MSSNKDFFKQTYQFAVPADLFFDAWTKKDLIHKWLFSVPTSKLIQIDLDLQVNGKFSILELEHSTNEKIDHYGIYPEIDPPGRLAFTLSVPKHFAGQTEVTVEIKDLPSEECCELVFTQTGVGEEITGDSWKKMFANLRLCLENQ